MGRSFILGNGLFLRVVNRIHLCLETTHALEPVQYIQFAGWLNRAPRCYGVGNIMHEIRNGQATLPILSYQQVASLFE